jgi:XTP/dITP diphosphohydrolase
MSEAFDRLVELIAQLRDPTDGCPWDLAQDHGSLRPYVVEEAHEVVAAIDSGNSDALASELGDLLLQVLLHSRIAEEVGEFTLDDVIAHLSDKLVRRHPHVFADAPSDLPSIRSRWETIKSGEGQHKTELPVLLAARKLASSLPEEAPLASMAAARGVEAEAGAALLSEIARLWRRGIDPEIALRKAVEAVREAQGSENA